MNQITPATIRAYYVEYYGSDLLQGVSDDTVEIYIRRASFLLDVIFHYSKNLTAIMNCDEMANYLNNAIAEEVYFLYAGQYYEIPDVSSGTEDLEQLEKLRDIGVREAHLDVIGVTFQSTYRYNNRILKYLSDRAGYWLVLLGYGIGNGVVSFSSDVQQLTDNLYTQAGRS